MACVGLNGPDFDPTSKPILVAPFTGNGSRAKNGGLALFLFNLSESAVILAGKSHEYKRGAV